MRQGLAEYVVVTALLVAIAAAAIALRGDALRAALGVRRAPDAAAASPRLSQAPSAR